MAQKENNIIPMIFDEAFIVKWLPKVATTGLQEGGRIL